MTVLAFIILTSRLAIRTCVVSNFGPDDWFIIAAMVPWNPIHLQDLVK